jgi:3'(2'), 5'-bisphosphate nucleotidase
VTLSFDAADDAELARHVATTAGELLLTVQRSGLFEGKALGKAGDMVSNDFILRALAEHRPNDAVLSEEEKNDTARCSQSRVWIVDPLDGTREYGEAREDWAVHVALAVGGEARLGAVALPALGLTLSSAGPLPQPAANTPPRMVVSRTRPPAEALKVAEAIGAALLPMGSAGAKAMAVVRGAADLYLHSGGQYEWDNCAPAAVAQAAGLHVSRLDGSPLRYNRPDPLLPDLLICRPEWAARVLELVRAAASA